jgi:hypothetical protein
MEKEIRNVLACLQQEIRKDLWFFASCGAFVSLLLVWHARLKEMGISEGKSWPEALFNDFVSFNSFGLIFIGLLGLGASAAILDRVGIKWERLDKTLIHLELRLIQITSTIISFTVGLSASALIHSLFTVTVGGVKLAFIIVIFNTMLLIGIFSSAVVARRVEPFNNWALSVFMLLSALGLTAWLIVKGAS